MKTGMGDQVKHVTRVKLVSIFREQVNILVLTQQSVSSRTHAREQSSQAEAGRYTARVCSGASFTCPSRSETIIAKFHRRKQITI